MTESDALIAESSRTTALSRNRAGGMDVALTKPGMPVAAISRSGHDSNSFWGRRSAV